MSNMRELSEISVVSAFAKEWAICTGAKSTLHIKASTFNVFSCIDDRNKHEILTVQDIPRDILFDLILGDLPIGLNQTVWNNGKKIIKAQRDWLDLLQSLASLKKNGTALFLLGPLGFSTLKGIAFERELNEHGFFVNAIFNTPEKLLQPLALITPIFVALSTTPTGNLFVAELLNNIQAQEVVRAYFSKINAGDLARGKYIDSGSYSGFNRLKIKQQIERLETQYKNYEEHSLGELAAEINSVKSGEQFKERDNAIYIPIIGNSQVVYQIDDAKMKHNNYFQVVLRESVINVYVASFFRSALGRLVLGSLTTSAIVPRFNKQEILQAIVAVPSLDEQKNIVQTQNKLNSLRHAIDGFDAELSLNPNSSSSILPQLETMLNAIGSLTDADRVRAIAREGESKYVEFKATLSLCLKKHTKEKYLEESALKTVVAFLNTDGGELLIGVSDNGQLLGLDTEIEKFHKTLDSFLKHFKDILKARIGEEYYPFIEYRAIKVDTKYILLVECSQSQTPCYLDKNGFYVRTNPATDKLEGPKLVEYVRNHFKS